MCRILHGLYGRQSCVPVCSYLTSGYSSCHRHSGTAMQHFLRTQGKWCYWMASRPHIVEADIHNWPVSNRKLSGRTLGALIKRIEPFYIKSRLTHRSPGILTVHRCRGKTISYNKHLLPGPQKVSFTTYTKLHISFIKDCQNIYIDYTFVTKST